MSGHSPLGYEPVTYMEGSFSQPRAVSVSVSFISVRDCAPGHARVTPAQVTDTGGC